MEIDIFLFGKPEWMIDLDKATPKDILDLGLEIKERLEKVSTIMEKLENNGWGRSAGLYDLFFYKGIDLENGKNELVSLDIDEKDISIRDDSLEWSNDETDEPEGN
jgi:hypothetical protein